MTKRMITAVIMAVMVTVAFVSTVFITGCDPIKDSGMTEREIEKRIA